MQKRKVGFVVDSTFGVEKAYAKKEQVSIVALKVIIDSEEFVDGEFDYQNVVKGLDQKKQITTSQPSPDAFSKAYQAQKDLGFEDVICLTLSKTLSGTVNSANLALTLEDHHNVHIFDTHTTINGGAYILEQAISYANEGHDIESVINYVNDLIQKGSLIFTVDNLNTLVKNGRLSKTSAFIGNILRIKPILRFALGKLDLEHKVRSFGNVVKYIVDQARILLAEAQVVVRVAYVDIDEKANELVDALKELGKKVDVHITGVISPVIAAHVGLGGLGVYIAKK